MGTFPQEDPEAIFWINVWTLKSNLWFYFWTLSIITSLFFVLFRVSYTSIKKNKCAYIFKHCFIIITCKENVWCVLFFFNTFVYWIINLNMQKEIKLYVVLKKEGWNQKQVKQIKLYLKFPNNFNQPHKYIYSPSSINFFQIDKDGKPLSYLMIFKNYPQI